MAIAVLALASFVAWFFSMLAGGGSPLVLMPLITLLFGSQAVAPVITTGLLVGNTQRSLFFWHDIDWRVTLWYTPGAIAGAILGSYTLTQIHVEWLQIIIAIALLVMVLNYWLSKRDTPFPVQAWYFLPIAFVNAVASGLVGSTGPIMNPVYLNYGLDKEKMIATKSLNKAMLHGVKIIAYVALGAFNGPFLIYGLVIGLGAIPANWLGKRVLERMSSERFRQLVFTFVAVSGVLMLWQQRNLLSGFVLG